MIKVIFRETIIILLLCVAILLILGVLFYDYNPIGKVVPNKIAYTVPEDIKDDLEEENIIEEELVMQNIIYKVEGSDLNIYKKSNSYNPGKANPFAETVSDSTSVVNNTATVQKETTINSTQNVDSNVQGQQKNEQKTTNTNGTTNTTFWNNTGSK